MIELESKYCGIVDTMYISNALVIPYLYHEAFHAFQQQWMKNRWHNFSLWAKYPEDDVENIALSHIENQILLSSIPAAERIARFASIRKYRLSLLSDEMSDFDQKGLLVEGTASYVEKRIIMVLLQSFDTVFSDLMKKTHQEEIIEYVNETALKINTSQLIYRWFGIGYRLGTALDILLPKWKKCLMEKPVLWEDLLEEYFSMSDSVKSLLNTFHYDKTLRCVEIKQQQRNQEIQTRIRNIQNTTERKLRLYYKNLHPTGFVFSPSDMIVVNAKMKLHTTIFGLQFSDEFNIDIKDTDVVEYVTEKYFECILPDDYSIKKEQNILTMKAKGLHIHIPYKKWVQAANGDSITIST